MYLLFKFPNNLQHYIFKTAESTPWSAALLKAATDYSEEEYWTVDIFISREKEFFTSKEKSKITRTTFQGYSLAAR